MKLHTRLNLGYVIASLVIIGTYGCKSEPKTQAPIVTVPQSKMAAGNTVGAVSEISGYAAVRVNGFGLVYGLTDTGSSEAPPTQKAYLIQHIRRYKDRLPKPYNKMTAEQIIESRSTAIVAVSGVVPPGAPKGEAFDVEVTILPQTQTTSLQGGTLMFTELRLITAQEGGTLAGRTTASAEGPVFINPFPLTARIADPNAASVRNDKSDPRRGKVLGGGHSMYNRQIKLSIYQADYRLASLIERRVNTRFGGANSPKIADAKGRDTILINIPQDFEHRYQYFISLLANLYLEERPGLMELHLRQLVDEAKMPTAKPARLEEIALSWEAIGKDCLTFIKPLFANAHDNLAYYAAKTCVNLGDLSGMDTLILIANDDNNPNQLKATKQLSDIAREPRALRARGALLQLLNKPNNRVRLLAYEGLRNCRDPRIRIAEMPGGFTLERAPSTAENLVCVWTVDQPRLVLLGQDWKCREDIFVELDDGAVTLNQQPPQDKISISRKTEDGVSFIRTQSSLRVEDLIYTLGMPLEKDTEEPPILTFSQIVGLIYRMCQDQKVIPATFYLHRVAEDLLG